MPAGKGLTAKEQLFVQHFLKTLKVLDAYRAAGYPPRHETKHANMIMRRPRIIAAIAAVQDVSLREVGLDAKEIKLEIRRLSLADPAQCLDVDGNLLPLRQMPADIRACIKKIEVMKRNEVAGDGKQDLVTKVEFWDKPAALAMAAKHLLLLVDRVEVVHRYPHAHLTDEELRQKLIEAAAEPKRLTGGHE